MQPYEWLCKIFHFGNNHQDYSDILSISKSTFEVEKMLIIMTQR